MQHPPLERGKGKVEEEDVKAPHQEFVQLSSEEGTIPAFGPSLPSGKQTGSSSRLEW